MTKIIEIKSPQSDRSSIKLGLLCWGWLQSTLEHCTANHRSSQHHFGTCIKTCLKCVNTGNGAVIWKWYDHRCNVTGWEWARTLNREMMWKRGMRVMKGIDEEIGNKWGRLEKRGETCLEMRKSTYPDPVPYWGHGKLRPVMPVEPTT